jgi:hypothetical protein
MYEVSGFDVSAVRALAVEVARKSQHPAQTEHSTREETYEERYLFGLLKRTKVRTVSVVSRKYWILGRIYYHNDYAHEAHGSSSYSYTDERELALQDDGALVVRRDDSGSVSWSDAAEGNLLALDFSETSRGSSPQQAGTMIEQWSEITRSGPPCVEAKGEGITRALTALL